MEAYNQLILQEMHSDSGMGVHKVSEKTNHRWKDGFLAGYLVGQRDALLDAKNVAVNLLSLGYSAESITSDISNMVKELE
jgi:hypothetical protein